MLPAPPSSSHGPANERGGTNSSYHRIKQPCRYTSTSPSSHDHLPPSSSPHSNIVFHSPLMYSILLPHSSHPSLLLPPPPLVSPLILYPMSHLPSPSQLPPWLSLTFLHPFVLLSHLTVCPCTSYNTILLHINQNSNYMTCKIGMVLCNHVCQLAEQEW